MFASKILNAARYPIHVICAIANPQLDLVWYQKRRMIIKHSTTRGFSLGMETFKYLAWLPKKEQSVVTLGIFNIF